MLSYCLRVDRKKSHSALTENTFVCKELDFDVNIVEGIVGYNNQCDRSDQTLILGQRPGGIHSANTCRSLSPSYSKEFISTRYHHSVAKNNYSLKYITTGQLSFSHF